MESLSRENLLQCEGGSWFGFATTLLISVISFSRLIKRIVRARK